MSISTSAMVVLVVLLIAVALAFRVMGRDEDGAQRLCKTPAIVGVLAFPHDVDRLFAELLTRHCRAHAAQYP